MKITILIRTFNSMRTLRMVVGKLLGDCSPNDILCVDSGSTDGTVEYLVSLGIRTIPYGPEPYSYGKALNIGFSACDDADWVIVLSSHCIPIHVDFISRYRKIFEKIPEEISLVSGDVVSVRRKLLIGDDLVILRSMKSALFRKLYIGNPNCAYRYCEWQRLKFDEIAVYSEDRIWCAASIQMGMWVAFSCAIPVIYRNPASIIKCFLNGIRAGQQRKRSYYHFSAEDITLPLIFRAIMRNIAMKLGRRFSHFL